MKNNKIWEIKGKSESYSDDELIEMIRKGIVKKTDLIVTKDMKNYLKVADSIYSFYVEDKLK